MDDREEREREQRIRLRAYRMWEEEGRPQGRADTHWDKATELVAIEDNQLRTLEPIAPPSGFGPNGEPIEPIEAVENAGEFPTMTDQGEQTFPQRRSASMPDPHAAGDEGGAGPAGRKRASGGANGRASTSR
jgi:hypothetical protein